MDLMKAIYQRKSIRKYLGKKLSQNELDEIRAMCEAEKRLYEDIDLRIVLVEEGDKIQKMMSGIVGSIGKVIAPHYLVVTSEVKAGYLVNAGYTVEKIVLKLTAMGYATCWLGGHVKEYELRETISFAENHEFIIIVALGYPLDEKKLYRKDPKEAKRKEISEFVKGSYSQEWRRILEAVRLAPSAANTQPWRISMEGNKAHVFCQKPKSLIMKRLLEDLYILDAGIALSHMTIAAEELKKELRFTRNDGIQNPQYYYVTTAELL